MTSPLVDQLDQNEFGLRRSDELADAIPNLPEELRGLLAQIPRGRVTTYGALATALGSSTAARWVGEYLVDHPHAADCPCHRVVRATGEPGLYVTRQTPDKEARLRREGVAVQNGRVDLAHRMFDDFQSSRPLAKLIDWQHHLAARVRLTPFGETPQMVAGVDAAYSQSGDAVGAYALVEVATGRCVWSTVVRQAARFPYIPGFLTFRELPVLLEAIRAAEREGRGAGLIFVDGNGILHPRRAGLATCLGVLAGLPTIGVGKSLLCGSTRLEGLRAGEVREIVHNDQLVGLAMRGADDRRPVFVSPGQGVTVADAGRMAAAAFGGHRLPEPLYHADRLSRGEAKRLNRDNQQTSTHL